MLPTTGHFKNISCPFYDACICERPYCHFKHSKRESLNDTNLISELVSKAVHKVLNSNISSPTESSEKPTEVPNYASGNGKNVTYNPTPISELNKYKSNTATKENSERRNRHIPIQYTPEQPRSFRSTITCSYSNSLEHSIDDSKNTLAGYSPSSNTQTSVSYIPSLIKTLTDNPASDSTSDSLTVASHTTAETNTHQYVPFNLKLDDSQISVLTAEYNPTKKLSLDSAPSYSEYVPKYNDEFIDEFINDPNIYEPTEISTSTKDKVNLKEENTGLKIEKIQSKSIIDKSQLSKEDIKDVRKEEMAIPSEEEKREIYRKRKGRKPLTSKQSSSSSSKKTPDIDDSRSSSSSHSKHTSKSRHKDKRKDRGKEDAQTNGCEKKQKHSDKKQKSHRSCSRNRDKHRKSVRSSNNKHEKSSVNSNKISENTKTNEYKTKFKESSDDDRGNSPTLDHVFDCNVVDLSDESDDELEQCKRIFEEYQPPVENTQTKKHTKPEPAENECSPIIPPSKKRVAHEKSSNVIRKQTIKPPRVKTAALVMANRYKQVLSNIEEKNYIVPSSESSDNLSHSAQVYKRPLNKILEKIADDTSQDLSYHNPAKIKRIAHVPNVSSLLNAKRKVEEIAKTKPISKTPMQTIAKGSKRVAHIPEVTVADIPNVLQCEKSKLPVNVRNKFLFLMVKECVKLYVSKKAAYDRALNEELNCYSKCSAIATYRNSVMLSINRLRKEAESGLNLSSSSSADNTSDFAGKKFYNNISKWILSEEELVDNGYPRPGAPKKGFALFKEYKLAEKVPENSQLCVRCKKIYKVDDNGFQMYPEDCIYHPGSRFVFRGETKYICCKESASNSGCCICSNHVFEIRDPANLSGFVSTFVPENSDDPKSFAVYALDCEMVYTTRGFELARITVIDSNCDVVYESMIKPTGHILDCNTRFSGLTTEMLEKVSTRITEVQATLLLMFNSKTILMGHSLESDLKALRLIHSTVIDTSVLFPHKMGPPKKRALRGLASDFLKKIIQNDEGGHDSAEDAITCMELIIWKLKEEIKLR